MKLFRRPDSANWYIDLRADGFKIISARTADKDEARRRAYTYLAQRQTPPTEAAGTLQALTDRYLAWVQATAHHTPRGLERTTATLTALVAFLGSDLPVSGLSSDRLRAFRDHRARTVKAETVNRDMTVIRGLCSHAITWSLLAVSPMVKVANLKERGDHLPQSYTVDEIAKILAVAQPTERLAWIIYANTGLRLSELLDLTWESVKAGYAVISRPKERRAKVVPLNAAALEAMALLPKDQDSPYVLPRWSRTAVTTKFRRDAAKAGVGGNLHRLRHSFATHLLTAGVPLPHVQELLGHAQISTTSRYVRALPQHLREAVEKLHFVTPRHTDDQKSECP